MSTPVTSRRGSIPQNDYNAHVRKVRHAMKPRFDPAAVDAAVDGQIRKFVVAQLNIGVDSTDTSASTGWITPKAGKSPSPKKAATPKASSVIRAIAGSSTPVSLTSTPVPFVADNWALPRPASRPSAVPPTAAQSIAIRPSAQRSVPASLNFAAVAGALAAPPAVVISPSNKSAFKVSPKRGKPVEKEKSGEQLAKIETLKSSALSKLTATHGSVSPVRDPSAAKYAVTPPAIDKSSVAVAATAARVRADTPNEQTAMKVVALRPASANSGLLRHVAPQSLTIKCDKQALKRLLFSQKSISRFFSDGYKTVDAAAEEFAKSGFAQSLAIDVVKMSEHSKTSFDNRRLYAAYTAAKKASKAGFEIFIKLHTAQDFRDNKSLKTQFNLLVTGGRTQHEADWLDELEYSENTWGSAIHLRIMTDNTAKREILSTNGFSFNEVTVRGGL